jgi:hypothetical protein
MVMKQGRDEKSTMEWENQNGAMEVMEKEGNKRCSR